MNKMTTILYTGLTIASFIIMVGTPLKVPAQTLSSVKPIFSDSISYFLKIDTAGVNVGYLRIGLSGVNLTVDSLKDEYAMWRIDSIVSGTYVFINKKTTDTLRFSVPTSPDTVATISRTGSIRDWPTSNHEFTDGQSKPFRWTYSLPSGTTNIFCLTLGKNGLVMLSSKTSMTDTHLYANISFFPERIISTPKANKYYLLKVDTLGSPTSSPEGYLSADTLLRRDSLSIVADTTGFGDLSLWRFVTDTIVCDTTYFHLFNKGTERPLTFKATGIDTIAEINDSDTIADATKLNQWRIPFFVEDTCGIFMTRDTSTNQKYYLGLQDTVVMLLGNPNSNVKRLYFALEEDGYTPTVPDSSILDTTQIYTVKYVGGAHADEYLADVLGDTVYTKDSLYYYYAHIPDGQFVVDRNNRFRLISRSSGRVNTSPDTPRDTLQKVVVGGVIRPNLYTNKINSRDTFEIAPITYGNIASYKTRPHLGYKYLSPYELNEYLFLFSCLSPDSLKGTFISYDNADSLLKLSGTDATDGANYFFLKVSNSPTITQGAYEIGGIPSLQQTCYEFRSYGDSTLYLSIDPQTSKLKMSRTLRTPFFLKEGKTEGLYYLVAPWNNAQSNSLKKAIVDTTGLFNMVKIDSTETNLFAITGNLKDSIEPPDPYTYLKDLPQGAGFYELTATGPGTYMMKKLSKNIYHYAALAREGESMLKSGSFTKYDLKLWIDTARGVSYNPNRPSFYIVKEEKEEGDTILASVYTSLTGYFLHVMDSTSNDYKVQLDDKFYKRVNFVRAKRDTNNALLLNTDGTTATSRDSVGFAGKNEQAINEYRFYFQETGIDGEYYIATERGYLENEPFARGYLSIVNDKMYIGRSRDNIDVVCKVRFDNYQANEVIITRPVSPAPEDIAKKITAIGGNGYVTILNAVGERVTLFNIVGQQFANRTLSSDNEQITAPRGIVIVRIGKIKTQKVVVK